MSEPAPCGRDDCPVPPRPPPRALRTVVWDAGTRLRRGHKRHHEDPAALVPGLGDTRFAPLSDTAHAYVAATTLAALLESAFHDAAPPDPKIPQAVVRLWAEAEVELRHPVRFVDLRDPELERLGIPRSALVATSAAHYPCTRRFASQLHGRSIGGQPTHGLVWHSRQTELHARALEGRPALSELLDQHPSEVAVIWEPPAPGGILRATGVGLGPLDEGEGRDYTIDLVAVLGIVSM